MHGHYRHNTVILSIVRNMPTNVSANTIFGHHKVDTIIGENYTIYNTIQYNHQCWCKQRGTRSRLQKSWRACVQMD